MSPRALTRLTFRAKHSPHIRLAKKKGCLDTNHCVTLRVFGKDFYPSVFGNGNFATCEVLTAATATGVHIGISVNQETPPFVDVTGRTAYELQVCTGPTAKYIWFRTLDASAKVNYVYTAHESSNFVKFTIEPPSRTV